MDENKLNANTQLSKSSAKKVKKQLNKLLLLIDKYKALCAALGVILTCYWNLLCDLFYRGYATRLGVDSLYIHNDSGSLLISVLAFLFGFALIIPFANKLSDQLDKNGRSILATLKCTGISLIISVIAFVAICVLIVTLGQQMVIEIAFIPLLFLTLSFSAFAVFFLQLITLLVSIPIHITKKLINKIVKKNTSFDANDIDKAQGVNSNCNAESMQVRVICTSGKVQISTASPNPRVHRKRVYRLTSVVRSRTTEQSADSDNNTKSKVPYILTVLLILFALCMALFFCIGRLSASAKKEFAFIVNDFENEITSSNTVQHNLILSETDEYYCLSAYTITDINKIEKVTVYTGHQTVINKSEIKEEIKIVKKKFDESEIVNDIPTTQRGVLFPL